MTIQLCAGCGDLINTENHPEYFDMPTGRWLCWWCFEVVVEEEPKEETVYG